VSGQQNKGGETISEILSWLARYKWKAIWTLSPSFPHTDALSVITAGRRILRLWEGHTGEALGTLLLAEPHPGTRIWHLHGLISAPDFNVDAFHAFSSKWGQSDVRQYRPNGGYCAYIAQKLLRDGVEWDLYGKIILKEGENAVYN